MVFKSTLYTLSFALLILPTLCGANNFLPALIIKHVNLLQELKERLHLKHKPSGHTVKTPTLAHYQAMTSAEVLEDEYPYGFSYGKKEIENCRKEYAKIFDQVVAREQELCDSHYVFYHGQKAHFRLWQDVLKEIYSFLNIHGPLKEFEFFRTWFDVEKSFNANQFIDDYEAKKAEEEKKSWGYEITGKPSWYDAEPFLTKNMLCANLSFFGNFTNSGESSFWYFKNNTNIYSADSKHLLEGLWIKFGFDLDYLDKIMKLQKLIQTDEGNILQIFIPKSKVDDYAFICQPFGTPIRHPIDAGSFDDVKMRHTKISPILDMYAQNPSAITNFDRLQARLLLSQDCLINPTNGVKIFRYNTVAEDKMRQFKRELQHLVNQMMQKWITTKKYKTAKGLNIKELIDRIKKGMHLRGLKSTTKTH